MRHLVSLPHPCIANGMHVPLGPSSSNHHNSTNSSPIDFKISSIDAQEDSASYHMQKYQRDSERRQKSMDKQGIEPWTPSKVESLLGIAARAGDAKDVSYH